ncbi:translation elongation factor Ts [Dermatophilus congolensis]|uniref:Elongation factor Ts n=1 Tax=Dermatophilus congolensis TaxID=1863 RepID=A0A239VFV4_9MICO|nr:translation elongation factor Ts [Dermatophilus congolensis]MBO3128850.1 elongation factor Ts [Dermatophilus congolensis]MBO3132512.1 elongation factor Ts [Dermatophilus congolensis]MBO3133327.1 elongation factor Ts [Dermatophilus congolensis]MBO3135562.1 elongation factor Ts [Dermatophilus congolensis]MBO3137801.1 elongation factor Ts [Dermatophilus congolensis]
MANYTTADIKEIREKTGAGMLDVKKALDEAEGDKGKAVELLRVKGLKGITKREGRSASNGLVAAKVEGNVGTLVEVNTETDFVAKGEKFIAMADQILQAAATSGAADVESLMEVDVEGQPVKKLIEDNAAAIGEKMEVRRVARIEGEHVVSYLHKTNPDLPPQVGVLFAFSGGDEQVGRDVAMHIAAFSPSVLTEDEIDEETVANERRIAEETAREEGKPEQALPKIIEGRVKGYFAENVLLDQKYAKDQKKTVAKVLEEAGATAIGFARFRVGS